MCFVGVNQKPLSAFELIELLEKFTSSPSYYFLRWTNRVGGFWERRSEEFPELEADILRRLQESQNNVDNNLTSKPSEPFPSPEGQLFNSVLEIRWKQQKGGYQVLILSSQKIENILAYDFKPISDSWEILEQSALIHSHTETRFPKNLNLEKINIAQRYFRDKNTATVHFVALTVKN